MVIFRIIVFAQACITAIQLQAAESNDPLIFEGLSFSALYRYWHQPSKTILNEANIIVSPLGLRVEQLPRQSGNVFIANYIEDSFWFVDRKRRLVHKIPVTVVEQEAPAEADSSDGEPSAFIQLTPCSGMSAEKMGVTTHQGRIVEKWYCTLDGELVEEQWYAENPGLVVRTQDKNGFSSEITSIVERDALPGLFRPPSQYSEVEIEELINPAVPISSYSEKESGQH